MANCFWAMPALATATSSAAELLDHLGDGGQHRVLVGDVGGEPDRPRPDPLGRLARLLGVEVEHRHRGAAQVHLPRRLEADPAGGAGDQGHLAVEVVEGHRRGRVPGAGRLRPAACRCAASTSATTAAIAASLSSRRSSSGLSSPRRAEM